MEYPCYIRCSHPKRIQESMTPYDDLGINLRNDEEGPSQAVPLAAPLTTPLPESFSLPPPSSIPPPSPPSLRPLTPVRTYEIAKEDAFEVFASHSAPAHVDSSNVLPLTPSESSDQSHQ